MSKFAVFDIDGTLIRWQLYHALADALAELGHIDAERFQQIRDARMVWKRRESTNSFKDYEAQLVKQYEEILSQITGRQFDQAVERVFNEYKDQVYTYTRDLIKDLNNDGYLLFAISGSQEELVSKIAAHYGFDDFVGRVDERKNGRFTGNSKTVVFDKDLALKKLVEKHHAGFSGSLGVGDSASDIKMLALVEQPIAFNPEQALFRHAKKEGWKVVVERKNMIYKLEMVDGAYLLA